MNIQELAYFLSGTLLDGVTEAFITDPSGVLPPSYNPEQDSGEIVNSQGVSTNINVPRGKQLLQNWFDGRIRRIVWTLRSGLGDSYMGYRVYVARRGESFIVSSVRSGAFDPSFGDWAREYIELHFKQYYMGSTTPGDGDETEDDSPPKRPEEPTRGHCDKAWLWQRLLPGAHHRIAPSVHFSQAMVISELFSQIGALYIYYNSRWTNKRIDGSDYAAIALLIGLFTGHIPTSWMYVAPTLELLSPIGPLIGLLECYSQESNHGHETVNPQEHNQTRY
jgi:hypothetical protein